MADLRADADASDIVSTVDNGDTTPGRVAIALSLLRPTGHWGTDEGAEGLLPAPPG